MKKQTLSIIIIIACLISIAAGGMLAINHARGSNNAGAIRGEQQAQGTAGGNSDARAQFAKMREEMADTMTLMGTVSGILRMEKSGQNQLSAAQSGDLLKVLNPLRDEKKLTKAQAREYTTKIKSTLTTEQRDTVAQMAERRRGGAAAGGTGGAAGGAGGYPRGGGTGGYGGAGGGGAAGGNGMRGGGTPGGTGNRAGGAGSFDPAAMAALKDVNPYYRETSANGRYDGRETMEELVTLLEKSAGK